MPKKHNDSGYKQTILQRRRDEALIQETYKSQLVMTLYTLHKDFGFGNKRLEKFIEEYNKTLECYNGNYVGYNNIKDLLFEETKIKIE